MAEARPRNVLSTLGWGLFALVMVGSMVTLVVVLGGESSDGRATIERYVAAVRAGQDVGADVGADEAAALTSALRATRSFGISNFQAQSGTACFWVTLRGEGGSTEARFVLVGEGEQRSVRAASLRRECNCPDPDYEQPCHLE